MLKVGTFLFSEQSITSESSIFFTPLPSSHSFFVSSFSSDLDKSSDVEVEASVLFKLLEMNESVFLGPSKRNRTNYNRNGSKSSRGYFRTVTQTVAFEGVCVCVFTWDGSVGLCVSRGPC